MGKRKNALFVFILSLFLVMAGCSSDSSSSSSSKEDSGEGGGSGELRVAINAQPPTLDPLMNPGVVTRDTSRLVFETLYTMDSNFHPVPMLAESVETDDEKKVYSFKLREGVMFQNGEEMTAEDVVASMNRWMEKSTVTGSTFEDATFEADGDYSVVLKLAQPSSLVLDLIASSKQSPNIMPKEVVESTPETGLKEYIGTGPFKFVEWKQDQYIHFTKNEEYQPVESQADGLSGKKEALVDNLYFDIVTDASTRLAGLQTGEYDIIYQVPRDSYEQVKSSSDLEAYVDPYGELFYFYNVNEGPASNVKIRQAINTALDMESIMTAAYANEELYWLDSGYMHKNINSWASNAGNQFYNQNDPEKAKKMLKEAGYNGEEFRLMVTRDFPEFYDAGIVIQDKLKEIGVNVKIDVYDWPTFTKKAQDPKAWDSMVAGTSLVTTPSQLLVISSTFAGGMADDKIKGLLKEIETTPNQEDAKKLWDELQAYAWEEYLPVSMLGGSYDVYGSSAKVEGFSVYTGPVLWNTSVKK